jgi:Methyltransferase domain
MQAAEKMKPVVKLDVGCGKNKKGPEWVGIDVLEFQGVDVVLDVGVRKLPYEDDSVDEIHSSHFLEHLGPMERIHFMNEAWRVMHKDSVMTLIVPAWSSCRAYGDMTHQWPPVSEFWFYYLDRAWRKQNAPHNDSEHVPWGYSCDFLFTQGYGMNQNLLSRHQEYQNFALQNFKEAALDIHATLKPRK